MALISIPEIQTERLVLRAPKMADLDRLTAFYASERSHIVGGPHDANATYRILNSVFGPWAMRGFGTWHIADKNTDALLGFTGVLFDLDWDEPEFSWAVLEEAEGKGIAFEAVSAMRQYVADNLDMDGLISYIAPSNTRSAVLATRLGAKFERNGTLFGDSIHVYRHPKLAGKSAS
jgi:RimJ/RimL family protein N-acetyltransferase